MFAALFLPEEYPDYLKVCFNFSKLNGPEPPLPVEIGRMLINNLKILDAQAFVDDLSLASEIIYLSDSKEKPLGIILIPQESVCIACGGLFYLRSDHSSRLTVYSSQFGSIPSKHYHKYCGKKGCKLLQYYGYTTNGDGCLHYSENWSSLPYFISSQVTAFEMKFLNMYDTELLIGELSYKQKADIYNCYHGYEDLDQQSGNDMIRRYVYVTIFTLYITITWSELCFGY